MITECLHALYRLLQMHRLATTIYYTTCSRGRLFVCLILLYWFVLPPLSVSPDQTQYATGYVGHVSKKKSVIVAVLASKINKYIYTYTK